MSARLSRRIVRRYCLSFDLPSELKRKMSIMHHKTILKKWKIIENLSYKINYELFIRPLFLRRAHIAPRTISVFRQFTRHFIFCLPVNCRNNLLIRNFQTEGTFCRAHTILNNFYALVRNYTRTPVCRSAFRLLLQHLLLFFYFFPNILVNITQIKTSSASFNLHKKMYEL